MLKPAAPPETPLLTASPLRLLAICGIVGPVFFATVVIVLASIEPGYNHVSHTISELGAVGAPNATIQNANFVVTGLLTLAFAFGLHGGIGGGKGPKIGPSLVAYWGLALIASGFFQGYPPTVTPMAILHDQGLLRFAASGLHVVAGLTGFAASGAAALILSRRLRTDPQWRSYGSFSVVAGVLMIVFLVGFFLSFTQFPAYTGAIQRLMVGTILLWTVVMAIRLLQISRQPQAHVASP